MSYSISKLNYRIISELPLVCCGPVIPEPPFIVGAYRTSSVISSVYISFNVRSRISGQDELYTLRIVGALQQACGFEYTSKLQRMFQDVGVSKDLNEHFKKHLAQSSDPLDSEYSLERSREREAPFRSIVNFVSFIVNEVYASLQKRNNAITKQNKCSVLRLTPSTN